MNPDLPIKGVLKPKCHPRMNHVKTATEDSCLTPGAVQKLKTYFNQAHPTHAIHSSDPFHIWQDLHSRLGRSCRGNERCWLNVVPGKEERKRLEDASFVTKMPHEWRDDPDAWLSNYDIKDVLKDYEEAYPDFVLLGPTTIDFDSVKKRDRTCVDEDLCHFQLHRLWKQGKRRIGVVFNTDVSTGSGKHWISLFIDLRDKFMMFFDSTGNKVRPQIRKFMQKVKRQARHLGIYLKEYDNHGVEHQMGDTECGMYSLFFIITMLLGQTDFHKRPMNAREKLDLFLKDFNIPDKYMQKYREIYFDKGS